MRIDELNAHLELIGYKIEYYGKIVAESVQEISISGANRP